MLNLNSVLIGTTNLEAMSSFYHKVIGKDPDMSEDNMKGWQVGGCFIGIMSHSKMEGKTKDAGRIMMNFETTDTKGEFERIKALGATVIAEPYQMGGEGGFIATLADPDGNYFQLVPPWEEPAK